MTRKFEQEGMKSYVSYQLYADSLKPPPKNNEDALEDWVDEMQTSRWAIKNDEAHKK